MEHGAEKAAGKENSELSDKLCVICGKNLAEFAEQRRFVVLFDNDAIYKRSPE